MNRPHTRRQLQIDDYHGTLVADPYRWLEDDTSPEVQKWIKEQNEYFDGYMDARGVRADLKASLTKLWHYARCSTPEYVEGQYYTWQNDGLQNQSVLYRSASPEDVGEMVFDPNTLSDDGTVAVSTWSFSPKGNYMAYGLSASGSDWQSIHVLDLRSKADLPDVLHHMKFSAITWTHDESGFFYTRYPEQKVDTVLEAVARNSMICLHTLGEEQAADKLIHNDPANPDWDFRFSADDKKKWGFMSVSYGTLFRNQLHYKPIAKLDAAWLPIASDFEEGYRVVGVIGDTAYIYTQKDAPFGQVMSLRLSESGASDWQTVIPDQGEAMQWAQMVNGHLLCCFLHHAAHVLKIYAPDGNLVREVELPAPGSVVGVAAKQSREEFFVQFSSFLYPAAVLRCDFSGKAPTICFAPKIDFPFDDYETTQVFFPSKDGTKVPMFITARKGIAKDGSHPTLLYGYGGFNISTSPLFAAQHLAWLERGGIYATVCMRGGSEYGEAWHRAGMLESKQNVFDDFMAAGEYLKSEGYTSTARIGIYGRSNGGLLTGACVTQRPELFGAVIVAVPVLDMLRYHKFTAGRYWVGEYGSAENPEQFPFLYKYSPLHNVRMNAVYPPTLVMTADTDDRVVPGQARKFSATMQAADAGENPIYVRIEESAGHGHGKPVGKFIDEWTDLYGFLLINLKEKK